jgi:hypothetical protein
MASKMKYLFSNSFLLVLIHLLPLKALSGEAGRLRAGRHLLWEYLEFDTCPTCFEDLPALWGAITDPCVKSALRDGLGWTGIMYNKYTALEAELGSSEGTYDCFVVPASVNTCWGALTPLQKRAARALCFDAVEWNGGTRGPEACAGNPDAVCSADNVVDDADCADVDDADWTGLSKCQQRVMVELGWDAEKWDCDVDCCIIPGTEDLCWSALTENERCWASKLYTKGCWES